MVLNVQPLVSCLMVFLNTTLHFDWVLCPGSTNCLCPEGFNGNRGGPAPKCLKFTTASMFCDPRTLMVQVVICCVLFFSLSCNKKRALKYFISPSYSTYQSTKISPPVKKTTFFYLFHPLRTINGAGSSYMVL